MGIGTYLHLNSPKIYIDNKSTNKSLYRVAYPDNYTPIDKNSSNNTKIQNFTMKNQHETSKIIPNLNK